MIFDLLIGAFITLITVVSLPLPSHEASSEQINSAVETIGTYIAMMDIIIAVNHLIIAIGVVLSFELIKASFQLIRWAIRSVPFLNSKI